MATSALVGSVLGIRRVQDDVARVLRHWILDGTLAPGMRLPVADLAERLGVSPMPVREAIRQLEASGLVATAPHRGAWVARLDPREVEELYDVRIILEPEAARRSAGRVESERAKLLEARLDDLREAVAGGDVSRALECDEALLTAIFEGSENRVLIEEISRLWERVRRYKLLHISSGHEVAAPARTERWATRLVEACISANGELAAQRVREPLETAKAELVAFTRTLPPKEA